MSLFALPSVGRAGLGNGLFPWARTEVFAKRTGARVLAPQWSGFRIGPYLRGEPEKRRYTGFFRADHHVRGISRFAVSTFGRRVPEASFGVGCGSSSKLRPCVVEFSGMADLFAPLRADHAFIHRQLWDMTEEPLRSTAQQYGGRFIAMHVRRGDITRQGFTPDELQGVYQYTPLSWFVSMASAIRRIDLLREIPIVVFTDGSPEEVAPLCAVAGVSLHRRQEAIADLWTLAHAGLLFASGFSTFSMWASFLGGMPTLYAPGKMQQRVQVEDGSAIELELAEGSPLPQAVFKRLS